MTSDINEKAKVIFNDGGYPIPIEQRPLWRLGLMCLCIHYLGSNTYGLSLIKLKLATWMLIREQDWSYYHEVLNDLSVKPNFFKDDAYTERTIELGMVKKFFMFEGKNLKLLECGHSLISLSLELDLFQSEIEFLNTIKAKFTDSFVNRVMGW